MYIHVKINKSLKLILKRRKQREAETTSMILPAFIWIVSGLWAIQWMLPDVPKCTPPATLYREWSVHCTLWGVGATWALFTRKAQRQTPSYFRSRCQQREHGHQGSTLALVGKAPPRIWAELLLPPPFLPSGCQLQMAIHIPLNSLTELPLEILTDIQKYTLLWGFSIQWGWQAKQGASTNAVLI